MMISKKVHDGKILSIWECSLPFEPKKTFNQRQSEVLKSFLITLTKGKNPLSKTHVNF